MAPKRAATLPEPSASSSEATSASASYSSDEAEDKEVETSRPSSPPKQKPIQKSSTTPLAPTPQPTKPIVKPTQNRPPAATASSDEQGDDEDDTDQEEISGEDGSGSEEADTDDARTNKQALPPPPPPVFPPTKPQPQSLLPKSTPPKPSSDSDSDSSEGSDSGSDSSEEDAAPAPAPRPSRAADPSIKPINSKPMDGPTRSGKPAVTRAPTPGQDSLRRKGDSVDSSQKDNNGGRGRQFFQRLWSLDDEITLLNGVVEYHLKNGCFPSKAGMDAVRDRIKGSLQMEVTSSQLVNKLRTLKKKFQTNVTRQKNGTGPTFTKRQEQVAFELSKKLWGIDKVSTEDVDASPVNEDNELCERETKVNRKRKEGNLKPVDVSDLSYAIDKKFKGTETGKAKYPLLWETVTKMADEKLCGVAIKRALERLDDVRANLMEEKLKKLRITQIKQHVRRADLDKKSLKLISDAIMRSG